MSLSLYNITIPVFINEMKMIGAILEKGRTHVSDEKTLFAAKLVDDMKPLSYQIQRISDTAKGVAIRVSKIEPVPMKDDESSFEELKERLAKTVAVLEKVDPRAMEANASQEVAFGPYKFPTATEYALNMAIPNFYFHVCMTYAILRKEGVPIGKQDYLVSAASWRQSS